jgi:hypothetical protein
LPDGNPSHRGEGVLCLAANTENILVSHNDFNCP